MSVAPTVAPTTESASTTGNDMTHYVCCEVPPGGSGPTLCGVRQSDVWEGVADEVDCVVCNDLADDDACPITGKPCPVND